MKSSHYPLYQVVIQSIPFKNRLAAHAFGLLVGHKIKAVVNQVTVGLDLCETIQREMFLESYEPLQTAWFMQCLRPGDVFVDVGASFGWYTTLGSSLVGPTGKVFSFEPSPVANQVIGHAILENPTFRNVVLTKSAVGGENGNVSLSLPVSRHLHSPSILQSDLKFVPVQVPVVALDCFEPLMNIPKIKLVKIDVEGYEPNVLTGMVNLIKEKRIENIICEFNSGWLKRNSMTPERLYERFINLGYQVRAQTRLESNVNGSDGEQWSLQDFWFSIP